MMLLLARDKTRIIRFAPVAFVLAFCHAVAGQPETPEDRLARLMDSAENGKVSLSLDRRGPYIPGERATVTITLTNATSNPLEIPDPNDARSGGLDLCTKGGPLAGAYHTEWSCPEHPTGGPALDVPGIMIQPGQTITMTHGSDELRGGTEEYWIGDGSMPKNEGTYQVQYGLGGVVEFQTSAPTLEASATAVLQHNDEFVDPETGESLSLPLKAIVLALRMGTDHIICISKGNITGDATMETDGQGKLDVSSAAAAAPILRVVGVPSAVTSLSATANSLELITIDYTGADGVHHLIHLDQNRHVM